MGQEENKITEGSNALLCNVGLKFRYTALGEPAFIKLTAEFADMGDAISFRDWTPDQLEAIASVMRESPELNKFRDGSGA